MTNRIDRIKDIENYANMENHKENESKRTALRDKKEEQRRRYAKEDVLCINDMGMQENGQQKKILIE